MIFKRIGLALGLACCFITTAQAATSCAVWADLKSNAQTTIVSMKVPSESTFHLTGRLVYRPLLVDEKTHWLGFQLYDAEAKLNNIASITQEYTVPFAVRISNISGDILEYKFNANLKHADQQKLIALYRAFHISKKPENLKGDQYFVEESDDIGKYRAAYTLIDSQNLQRKKLNYITSEEDKNKSNYAKNLLKINDADILKDQFNFFTDQCWISQTQGESHVKVMSSDGNMDIDVLQHLELTRSKLPLTDDIRLLNLPENPKEWGNIDEALIYPKAPPQPLSSVKAFISVLKNINWLKGDREDILNFLYDNDQYLDHLMSVIAEKQLDDKIESKLFMYLGKHDSANSKVLLTDVFLQETLFSPNQRFRSLMALKYSENPLAAEQVDAIFEYSNSMGLQGENLKLAHTGMMVVGVIAKNQKGSEFASELTQRLAETLRYTNAEHNSAALIAALGNSADRSHEKLIGKYLDADSPRLRSNAADALAKMPSSSSLKYLSHQLSHEKDTKAQSAIIKAIGKNELSPRHLNTLFDYAKPNKKIDIRSAAISALADQVDTHPEVKENLKQLVKSESNQRNLRKLMKAIYSSDSE